MKRALLLGLFMLPFLSLMAQEEGEAGLSPLFFPEQKAQLPKETNETSGLFFYNGRLWTHNDSHGMPMLYALDTTTFEIVQRVTLVNAKNKDWEDVCSDGESVYVGDFGNNKGKRKNLRIYTFPLSAIPAEGDATLMVDSITFRFADQKSFKHKKRKHDFDCEAIFATDSSLYLFSKGWATGTTRMYRLPKTPGARVAEVVNSFDSQGLITGADYDRKRHILAIVGYENPIKDGLFSPFMYLIFGFEEDGVNLSHRRFEMPQWIGTQTEGICFFDDGRCFVSAETTSIRASRVFVVDFRKWIEEEMENGEQ